MWPPVYLLLSCHEGPVPGPVSKGYVKPVYCLSLSMSSAVLFSAGCPTSSVVMQTELLPYLAIINAPLSSSGEKMLHFVASLYAMLVFELEMSP